MERTSVPTDIKDAYLQSELYSDATLYLHAPVPVPSDPSPTSAPTVVDVTEAGSHTGTATTEADRVCSAKDTHEMADGLQIAETHTISALALTFNLENISKRAYACYSAHTAAH